MGCHHLFSGFRYGFLVVIDCLRPVPIWLSSFINPQHQQSLTMTISIPSLYIDTFLKVTFIHTLNILLILPRLFPSVTLAGAGSALDRFSMAHEAVPPTILTQLLKFAKRQPYKIRSECHLPHLL